MSALLFGYKGQRIGLGLKIQKHKRLFNVPFVVSAKLQIWLGMIVIIVVIVPSYFVLESMES